MALRSKRIQNVRPAVGKWKMEKKKEVKRKWGADREEQKKNNRKKNNKREGTFLLCHSRAFPLCPAGAVCDGVLLQEDRPEPPETQDQILPAGADHHRPAGQEQRPQLNEMCHHAGVKQVRRLAVRCRCTTSRQPLLVGVFCQCLWKEIVFLCYKVTFADENLNIHHPSIHPLGRGTSWIRLRQTTKYSPHSCKMQI